MSISFNENQYEALVLEVAIVVEGDPTPPHSPAPSNAVGKTPTTDYRLVDLAATVDGGTGVLRRQYTWPEDTCRFSPHVDSAATPSHKEEGLSSCGEINLPIQSPVLGIYTKGP